MTSDWGKWQGWGRHSLSSFCFWRSQDIDWKQAAGLFLGSKPKQQKKELVLSWSHINKKQNKETDLDKEVEPWQKLREMTPGELFRQGSGSGWDRWDVLHMSQGTRMWRLHARKTSMLLYSRDDGSEIRALIGDGGGGHIFILYRRIL